MRGKRPREQIIILYIWACTLHGIEWTFKDMTKMCGCGVDRKLLDVLIGENVLELVPESERETAKPCHAYRVGAGFAPDRPPKAPESPRKAPKYPSWVWAAIKIWKRSRGILGPQRIFTAMGPAVKECGSGMVLSALDRYAREADPTYNPGPEGCMKNLASWAPKKDAQMTSKSYADM